MSIFIGPPNGLLAKVRVLVCSNKVVAAINLAAAIKVVRWDQSRGITCFVVSRVKAASEQHERLVGAKFNASDYSNYEK